MKILIFENQKKIKEFDVVLKNKCPSAPIDEKAKYAINKKLLVYISKNKKVLRALINQTRSIIFNKKGRSAAA